MQIRTARLGETITLRKKLVGDSSLYTSQGVCNGERTFKVPDMVEVKSDYVEFRYVVGSDWTEGSYAFVVEESGVNRGLCYVFVEKRGLVIEL